MWSARCVCFEHHSKIDHFKIQPSWRATSSNCLSGDLSAALWVLWECILHPRLECEETKENDCELRCRFWNNPWRVLYLYVAVCGAFLPFPFLFDSLVSLSSLNNWIKLWSLPRVPLIYIDIWFKGVGGICLPAFWLVWVRHGQGSAGSLQCT